MKKIIQFLFVGALLSLAGWGLISSETGAAPSPLRLYVSPESTQVSTGTTFSLQVRLEKNTSERVDYVYADMKYPTAILEVISISKAGSHFTVNNGPSTSYSNTTGALTIAGSGSELPTPANVLVGTVLFRAKATGTAQFSFTSSSKAGRQLGGTNVKNLLDTATGATISVVAPPPTPQPVAPVAPSSPVAPAPIDEPVAEETANDETQDSADVSEEDQEAALSTAPDFSDIGQAAGESDEGSVQSLVVVVASLLAIGGVLAWFFIRYLSRHHKTMSQQQLAQKRLVDMANLNQSFEVVGGAKINREPTTETTHEQVSPEALQSIENSLVGVRVAAPQLTPTGDTSAISTGEAVVSAPERAWTLNGAADIPDMFEVGQARLRSEGYDEKLRPATNHR